MKREWGILISALSIAALSVLGLGKGVANAQATGGYYNDGYQKIVDRGDPTPDAQYSDEESDSLERGRGGGGRGHSMGHRGGHHRGHSVGHRGHHRGHHARNRHHGHNRHHAHNRHHRHHRHHHHRHHGWYATVGVEPEPIVGIEPEPVGVEPAPIVGIEPEPVCPEQPCIEPEPPCPCSDGRCAENDR
jgi:hypothetical protein